MSNLNTSVLDPPTHSCINLTQTVGRFDMWVTPKTSRPSFCLIIKLSLMHWMVCSVCYLGCMVVNINALFAEWRITERGYFQVLLLWILSGMEPTIYFQIAISRCRDGHFPCFGKYIFPPLQTRIALVLSANCTEGSCSSNIVIFNNFLVFNFLFFNFEQ